MRRGGALLRMMSPRLLKRRSNELLSFDAVRSSLPVYGQSYRGVQEVPVDKIVGTTSNRYADFDRAFLPSQARTKARWKNIDELRLRDVNLPPVQVYQVGEVYFVRDGHHRVSVARQTGQNYIDAEVIEMQTRAPLTQRHSTSGPQRAGSTRRICLIPGENTARQIASRRKYRIFPARRIWALVGTHRRAPVFSRSRLPARCVVGGSGHGLVRFYVYADCEHDS